MRRKAKSVKTHIWRGTWYNAIGAGSFLCGGVYTHSLTGCCRTSPLCQTRGIRVDAQLAGHDKIVLFFFPPQAELKCYMLGSFLLCGLAVIITPEIHEKTFLTFTIRCLPDFEERTTEDQITLDVRCHAHVKENRFIYIQSIY